MKRTRVGFLGAMLLFGLGCSEDTKSDEPLQVELGNNDCQHGFNGVCDEPTRCELGTDDFDCQQVCAMSSDDWAPFTKMACTFRSKEISTDPRVSRHRAVALWQDKVLDARTAEGATIPRHYRVYRPTHLRRDTSAALVLMLPGNRVSHYSLSDYTALEHAAEANGFVLVHVEQPWRDRTFSWSWYTDWDWANDAEGNPDLIFLRELVATVTRDENIDSEQVYFAGHSRGAAMSLIAALEMPDIVSGAVIQSGFVEFGYFDRLSQMTAVDRRPKLFFMHGTVDDDVCIDCSPGGRCGVSPSRQCGTVASADALVERLREQGYDESSLVYARLENVAHRWQPWMNHIWWQFMNGQTAQERPEMFTAIESFQLDVHAPMVDQDDMISISAGAFEMGTSLELPVNRYGDGWYVNEQPAHTVEWGEFAIDAREVTVGAYAQFIQFACGGDCLDERMPIEIKDGVVSAIDNVSNTPITFVSRDDARAFCAWRGKRLPTETEFERAARGNDDSDWPWQVDAGPRCAYTNFSYEGGRCAHDLYESGEREEHVTSEGVFDLGGNVAEWVSDEFLAYPGSVNASVTGDRLGLVRGGSYLTPRSFLKPKARLPVASHVRAPDIGFRCARDASTVDPSGLLRGMMPEVSRVEGPAERDTFVFATALEQPRAIIAHDGVVWASTQDGVSLVFDDGSTQQIHDVSVDKWLDDGATLLGINFESQSLCSFSQSDPITCRVLQDVVDVGTKDNRVYWTDGVSVFVSTDGEDSVIVPNRSGVRSLSLIGDDLWLSEVTPSGPFLVRFNLTQEVVQEETVLTPEQIPSPLMIDHMVAGDEGELWLTVGFLEQWPYSSLLCRLDTTAQRFGCVTHTPPRSIPLTMFFGQLLWR
ncbi:MAG: SUMF1/EgtB/PvdO family nonheme iron enzyme, partial [Bradymonadia bacterium]